MDIICRKKRMQGYNVLYPIGFDAFGLPTENFAIKNHIHPAIVTKKNIENFTRQLKMLGYGFDWDRVVDTTDPELLQVDAVDLPADVQARPGLQDHHARQLVHELQVRAGQRRGRRGRVRALRRAGRPQGKEPVDAAHHQIRRPSDRRSGRGLDYIERVKTQQRNWIGRSTGTEVTFKTNTEDDITVYTTRVDTLFGVTYTVISPEHPLLEQVEGPASPTGPTSRPTRRLPPASPTLSAAS